MPDTENTCKLCGGATIYKFSKTLLKKFDARYHLCSNCGSLQVLDTAVLDEAYRNQNWALDTGLVARNLLLAGQLPLLFDGLLAKNDLIVDYGGGTGLLTRLLRDMGFIVLAYDKFGMPLFVNAFHVSSIDNLTCKAMIASEVLEHFDRPCEEIEMILSHTEMLIFTTEFYSAQDENWWYRAPFTGQHIFFWSAKAVEAVFAKFGFKLLNFGFYKIGIKESLLATGNVRNRLFAWSNDVRGMAISGSNLRPFRNYLSEPFKYVGSDYDAEIKKYNDQPGN